MRVLVINQGHTNNFGDQAINHVLTEALRKSCIEPVCFPFWEDLIVGLPRHLNKINRAFVYHMPALIDSLNKRRIQKYLENDRFDAAIIGGGELLNSHPGFISSLYCWISILIQKGIPVYVVGVSGDCKRYPHLFKRNTGVLNKCSYFSVRDEHSYNTYILSCPKVLRVHDVVFSISEFYHMPESNEQLDKWCFIPIPYSRTLEHYTGLKSEEKYCEYITGYLNNIPAKEIVLTNTDMDDLNFIDNYYHVVKGKTNKNIVVKKCISLEELLNVLCSVEGVLSMRMHALIIAFSQKKKIVAIPFKEKLATFSSMYCGKTDHEMIIAKAKIQMDEVINEILCTSGND